MPRIFQCFQLFHTHTHIHKTESAVNPQQLFDFVIQQNVLAWNLLFCCSYLLRRLPWLLDLNQNNESNPFLPYLFAATQYDGIPIKMPHLPEHCKQFYLWIPLQKWMVPRNQHKFEYFIESSLMLYAYNHIQFDENHCSIHCFVCFLIQLQPRIKYRYIEIFSFSYFK